MTATYEPGELVDIGDDDRSLLGRIHEVYPSSPPWSELVKVRVRTATLGEYTTGWISSSNIKRIKHV